MVDNVQNKFDDYCCVFRLVKFAINSIKGNVDDLVLDWKNVFILANQMSFTVLAKIGIDLLTGENKPEKEVKDLFNKEYKKQILIDANQLYELNLMISAFEKEKIDMLILKGSSIKEFYPYTHYRYMGDIDTLVNKSDFDKADKVLSSLGYEEISFGTHDRTYLKKPFINLEQHFNIAEEDSKRIINYYGDIWSKSKLKSNFSHIYEMTLEDIYIYLSVHSVHHIKYSGIAPRIFLDYYVFLEKYKDILNMQYVDKILTEFGYKAFNDAAVKFAYKWFSKKGAGLDKNSTVDLFVADCSTYGATEHNVGLRTARLTKNGKKPSKLFFILKQAFPPYSRIKSEFPVIKKCPLVLPFVWSAYVLKRVFKSRTAKYYSYINEETAAFYSSIIADLGLNNIDK